MQLNNDLVLQKIQFNNYGKNADSKQRLSTSTSRCKSRNGNAAQWTPDVNILLSSSDWLKLHGLKKYKLELKQILKSIGFKHSEEYVKSLQKPVKASYSKGLFPQYAYADGTIYNLLATAEKLRRIEAQLSQVINLYQERLEWLTSSSRLVFGVIQEQAISVVLDMQCSSRTELNLIKNALTNLVKEQFLFVSRFNIIRCAPQVDRWQEKSVNLTTDSIEGVIRWINNLQLEPQHDISCTVEGLLQASNDPQIESIYLCTDGLCAVSTRELLKRKLEDILIPVQIVALNCVSPSSLTFFQDVSAARGSRFHKFCLSKNSGDDLTLSTLDDRLSEDAIDYGKPSKMEVGVRQDVIELWEELDTAKNALAEVQAIQLHINQKNETLDTSGEVNIAEEEKSKNETKIGSNQNELYMSSREWLKKHSLSAKKLGFYDLLSTTAFRHCDGVVEVPNPRNESKVATVKSKLVNARYCDKFAHVRWKDGEIFHVHISGDVHRNYERRITAILDSYKQRVLWLQKGSRELFGTIIEDQVTILIDTSGSMDSRLFLVKDKLYQLLQEQIKHKQKFNLIKFDSRVQAWRSRLVDCTDKNIDDAWQWVKGLVVGGSTNTLGALKLALSDPLCSAVYLLTDGRPDQPPLTILSQVHLQDPVPIHTISFNCSDEAANEFLYKLSENTSARFHYFSENGTDECGPKTFESEDLRLIRDEIEKGVHDLERLTRLRNWCAQLDWYGSKKEEKTESTRSPVKPASAPFLRRPKQAPNTTSSRPRPVRKKKVKKPKAQVIKAQEVRSSTPSEEVVEEDDQKKDTSSSSDSSSSSSSSGNDSDDEKKSTKSEKSLQMSEKSLKMSKSVDLSEEEKEPLTHSVDIPKDTKKEKENVKKKKKQKPRKPALRSIQTVAEENRSSTKSFNESKPAKNTRYMSNNSNKSPYENSRSHTPQKEAPKGPWLRNHKVLARNDVDGFYYPGVLRTNINSRYADVAFCDFESQIVSLRYIIPNEGARPCPTLKVGDFVLVKTVREAGLSCYVPGVVYVVPLRQSGATKYHTIIQYHGKKTTALRKDLVKISHSRYAFACRYIKDCEITANKSPSVPTISLKKEKKEQSDGEDSSNDDSDSDEEKSQMTKNDKKSRSGHGSSDEKDSPQNENDVGVTSINEELEEIKKSLTETKESQLKSFEEQQGRFDNLRQQLHEAMEEQAMRQEELKKHYDSLLAGKGDGSAEHDRKLEEAKRLLQEQQENMVNDFKKQQKLLDELLQQNSPDQDEVDGRAGNGEKKSKKGKHERKGKNRSSSTSSSSSSDTEDDSSAEQQGDLPQNGDQPDDETVNKETAAPSKIEFHVTSSGKEACLWTKGSHGLLISRAPLEEDSAVEKRTVPTRLQSSEEVLARWPDDGWYYRGTIHEPAGDNYFVEDSVGNMEEISRVNIISDEDDAANDIKVNDAVVALHPSFSFRYAPGVLVDIEDNLQYRIRFYDGQQDTIPREEIYYLAQDKFTDAVNFIVRCEESLVGQAVVARNDFDGLFYLGKILERVGNGRQYVVQWPEGNAQVQSSAFIFGAHTKRHQLAVGDKVLALSNTARTLYEPGWVTGIKGKKLTVKFSKRSNQVDPMQCFWLSSDYYDIIVDYISKNIKP